jgi:HD superfamily phosphodiesterase
MPIDSAKLESLKKAFAAYVASYKNGDKEYDRHIDLKLVHTYKVCDCAKEIGESLNLSESEMNIAETIALFHDSGRFEQYKNYGTFNDANSENHGTLAVKVIEKENFLDGVDDKTVELVCFAVGNHNALDLPEDDREEYIFFTKLIRDADKLDIYRVVTEFYEEMEENPSSAVILDLSVDGDISEWIYEELLERRKISMRKLKTLNDFKMLQIGWLYDINFPRTLELIRERGYMEAIFNKLPKNKEVLRVYESISQYLDEKTGN